MKNNVVRSIFNFLLLFFIAMLVLYFSLKDDYEIIIHEITHMNLLFLCIAICMVILYWFFKAVILKRVASTFNPQYSLKKAMRLILETNFFHAVTPFASGGQPYEIYSLNKEKIKVTDATNVSIQNFIIYQIALVSLGIVSLFANYFFHLFSNNEVLEKLVALGFFMNTLVIVILFLGTFGRKLNRKLIDGGIIVLHKMHLIKDKDAKLQKADQYLSEFHTGAKILLQDKKKFISLILIQLLSLICLYLVPLFLLYAIGSYSSFTAFEAIVTSAYVMLIGSFVPIPGGTGGLEYGFIAFYGNFITGGSLKAIMLVWRFITYYFGMVLGAIILNIKKR